MPEVKVSNEICYYVSDEDYQKLVSEPSFSESECTFKESKSLSQILEEFGY